MSAVINLDDLPPIDASEMARNEFVICGYYADLTLTDEQFELVYQEFMRRKAAGNHEPLGDSEVRSIIGMPV